MNFPAHIGKEAVQSVYEAHFIISMWTEYRMCVVDVTKGTFRYNIERNVLVTKEIHWDISQRLYSWERFFVCPTQTSCPLAIFLRF